MIAGHRLPTTASLIAAVGLALTVVGVRGVAAEPLNPSFRAVAGGAQMVPEVATATHARVRVSFNRDLSEASFSLRVRAGTAITAAHLHCAPAGENGPIVLPLFEPESPGVDLDGPAASGLVTAADLLPTAGDPCGLTINNLASLKAAMRAGRVYLAVHSETEPAGVVRGQLVAFD